MKCTRAPIFIALFLTRINKLNISVRRGVKVVHKPALLKNKLVLLCFWLRYDTTVFPFDFLGIMYMHRGCVF